MDRGRSLAASVLAGLLLVSTGCSDGATSPRPEQLPAPTGTSSSASAGPSKALHGLGYAPATQPPAVESPRPGLFVWASAFADSTYGADQVWIDFSGGAPTCVARYVDPPVTDAVSGDPVRVAGTAFLQVRCREVSGVQIEDHGDSGATILRPGHDRFRPAGTKNVIEVVQTGYHGSTLTLTIGLRRKAPMGVGGFGGNARSGPIVVIAH